MTDAAPNAPSPLWPLLATLAMQTLATMATFSVPAVAPAVAHDLGVAGGIVGMFVAIVYGVGIVSSLLAPSFVQRFGATRVVQIVLLAVVVMLAVCSSGALASLGIGAALLGLAYGATAPASAHLLAPRTPQRVFNLVMSIRQIGVPLGGVFAGVVLPPLALHYGWRVAIAAEIPVVIALALALQLPRRGWDADRKPGYPLFVGALAKPLRLWRENASIRRLTLASFAYTSVQLCFVTFMTVHLTQSAKIDLVTAGWILAVYQVAGALSRPLLGFIADRFITPTRLLALTGLLMCAASEAFAGLDPHWRGWQVVLVCLLAGASGSGFTGLAYAEFARLGGDRRTEATGLGSAAMFLGVLIVPPAFGLLAAALGSFSMSFVALGALALVGGAIMLAPGDRG
ncbi:MAG: MFS transporter [Hyphomicrobiales bacterium]|nr:MFS transporter [Hyphomicrobiales bacterium]